MTGASSKQQQLVCYEGSCACGAVSVGLLCEPLLAYRCHCSNCRAFASKFKAIRAYQQAIWCWKWTSVVTKGAHVLEYERSSGFYGLFAMHRGRCSQCKMPVIEKGTMDSMAYPYCMVMVPPLKGIECNTNLFFDSGEMKETDRDEMQTTIYSDMGSLLFELYILVTVGLFRLPGSILARMRYNDWLVKKKS